MSPARIRLAEESDAEAVAAIYRPSVESSAISFETIAPDRGEIAARLRDILAVYPWLVCELGGFVAGYAYATYHKPRAAYRWSVDTSVYVSANHHRVGVGRGLYTSLFDILTAQGFVNAYAGIALPNPASVRLHEGVGFVPVGVYRRVGFKLGQWHDVGWWERQLAGHAASPPEPQPIGALKSDARWDSWLARGASLIRA